jgi:hypothetical protein
MRILYPLSVIYIGLALTSCASTIEQSAPKQPNKLIATKPLPPTSHHKKNPLTVSFYSKERLKIPYTIIGEESISKFNQGGNKRQEASIRDGMRELAAAMGGDAVINIKHDANTISGTVVAYQKDKEVSKG